MKKKPLERELGYFQREMEHLLANTQRFAKAHPLTARALELHEKGSGDPHVQRLLESFAFLAGNLQQEIDESQAIFSQGLLSLLYPQLSAIVPSKTVVQFLYHPSKAQEMAGRRVPAFTGLSALAQTGARCRFQTTREMVLSGLEVLDVAYARVQDFDLPPLSAPWLLRIKLRAGMGALEEMNLAHTSFYLGGDLTNALTLYGWIQTFSPEAPPPVWVLSGTSPIPLPPGSLSSPDFLQKTPFFQTHPAHQLLLDYFSCPQHFLFLDLQGLDKVGLRGETFELLIGLCEFADPLKCPLSKASLQLNSVPVTNLFLKTAEPLRHNHQRVEYLLCPDSRAEENIEIYKVLSVSSAYDPNEKGPRRQYCPYFSYEHAEREDGRELFWHETRQPCRLPGVPGTDLWLSFVNAQMDVDRFAEEVLYAHTLCTNRTMASRIPPLAILDFDEGAQGLTGVVLETPTMPSWPSLRQQTQWRLISHLGIDHAGPLTQDGAPLKELLSLYASLTSGEVAALWEHIESVQVVPGVEALRTAAHFGFVPKRSLRISFSTTQAKSPHLFLFAQILDAFLQMTAAANTLVETQFFQKEHTKRLWKKWTPRGTQTV